MDKLITKAAKIKLLITDVDGVLTDGQLYYSDQGETLKAFHVHDGLGLKLLRENGVEVAIITSRISKMLSVRMEQLGVEYIYQNQRDKLQAFDDLLSQLQLNPDQVAFIGDDLPDLKLILRAGLGIAVANALPIIKESAHFITTNPGGNGAVRECCDVILSAQNKMADVLETFK